MEYFSNSRHILRAVETLNWTWQATLDCELLSSSYFLRVKHGGFALIALSTALLFTVLGLPDLTRLSSLLQPEWTFQNRVLNLLCSIVPSNFVQHIFFGWFRAFLPSSNSECVSSRKKKKKKNPTTHIYLCGFQIAHVVKQCTTCYLTNYHDTTFAQSAGDVEYTYCISAER